MNSIDRQYKELLEHVLHFGVEKKDRTGTGTKSIFGWQIRHNMKEGFPLLTTKKMAFKTMVTELLWFLRGDTNIKYLVENGCNIWTGDAYKRYLDNVKDIEDGKQVEREDGKVYTYKILTKEQFADHIKNEDWFAKVWGELGPIYGKQWRSWKGDTWVEGSTDGTEGFYLQSEKIDQIKNLINELKTNPDSRRLMVSAWNVGELYKVVLPPCHYGFQVYTRELSLEERFNLAGNVYPPGGLPNQAIHFMNERNIPKRAISLMWNQRSVDTFLGLPFNIASYGLLLEIIAKTVNMVPDELIGNLGDVHLYNNHLEQAKEQISRTPYELPKLKMNPIFLANLEHKGLDEAINGQVNFEVENYQYHPSIKALLSN